MKSKVVTVAILLWLIAGTGGGVWSWVERSYIQWKTPPASREMQKLGDLYLAGQYGDALSECSRVETDETLTSCRPQILFIRWSADRKCGRNDDANKLEDVFVRTFPESPLLADMYFANATDSLSAGDAAAAERSLYFISQRYPGAPVSYRATQLLARLRATSAVPIATLSQGSH